MLRACGFGLMVLWSLSSPIALAQHDQAVLTVERGMADMSRDSGFTQALLSRAHPAAVLLWPGAPMTAGAADLKKLLTTIDSDSLLVTWQPLQVELARDSSLATTWGMVVAVKGRGRRTMDIGRYIAAWRRDNSQWTIAALVFSGLPPLPAAEVPRDLAAALPPIRPTGTAAPFAQADVAFARLAADSGAGPAFKRWASPEAVMFGRGGLLIRGPDEIGQAVAGPARWRWYPVAAGAAGSGDLGWTVGQAVISPPNGAPSHSKYLTIWRRRSDGTVRFLTDGGNERPAGDP